VNFETRVSGLLPEHLPMTPRSRISSGWLRELLRVPRDSGNPDFTVTPGSRKSFPLDRVRGTVPGDSGIPNVLTWTPGYGNNSR